MAKSDIVKFGFASDILFGLNKDVVSHLEIGNFYFCLNWSEDSINFLPESLN